MAQHHSVIIDFALTAAIHLSQHSHANYRATIINQSPFTTRAKINVAKIPLHQQWHTLLSSISRPLLGINLTQTYANQG